MLVTEKHGSLRRFAPGAAVSRAVGGTPRALQQEDSGLLDIVLDPRFAENGLVYLAFVEGDSAANHAALFRARLEGDQLLNGCVVFRAFVRGLAERSLRRVRMRGGEVVLQETLLRELGARIRDVRNGTDEYLYLPTDDANGSVLRLRPAGR